MPRKKATPALPPEETPEMALPDTPVEDGPALSEPSLHDETAPPLEIPADGNGEVAEASEETPQDGLSQDKLPQDLPMDATDSASDFPSDDPFQEVEVHDDSTPNDASKVDSEDASESLDALLAGLDTGTDEDSEDAPTPADGKDPPDTADAEASPSVEPAPAPKRKRATRRSKKMADPVPASDTEPRKAAPSSAPLSSAILSIDAKDEVESAEYREDTIWHEIRNAYRTRRILTGILGGVEQTESGKTLVIVEYKGFRVVIPASEMRVNQGPHVSGEAYADRMRRQNKILSAMIGAEIDFIVRGISNKERSIVASRREAMLRKRQTFYMEPDQNGLFRIYEGKLVQARVTAVAESLIFIEAFGVECSILARDLSWDWMGDAHDRFSVGDRIVVRIRDVRRDSLEDISIRADVKSVSTSTDIDNLKKCRVQGKYAGKVAGNYKGVVFVRLTNGVNAIAHSCLDRRTPGKRDDVSFAVTHIDMDQGVAMGIITKIIKQNL